jgi:hypothetical protein
MIVFFVESTTFIAFVSSFLIFSLDFASVFSSAIVSFTGTTTASVILGSERKGILIILPVISFSEVILFL